LKTKKKGNGLETIGGFVHSYSGMKRSEQRGEVSINLKRRSRVVMLLIGKLSMKT
jgi:hypothetical protein